MSDAVSSNATTAGAFAPGSTGSGGQDFLQL